MSIRRSSMTGPPDEYRDYVVETIQHKATNDGANDNNVRSESEVVGGDLARDELAELVWLDARIWLAINAGASTTGNGTVCTVQSGLTDDAIVLDMGTLADNSGDGTRQLNETTDGVGEPGTVTDPDVFFLDLLHIFSGGSDSIGSYFVRPYKKNLGGGPVVYHNDEVQTIFRFNNKGLSVSHECIVLMQAVWDVRPIESGEAPR